MTPCFFCEPIASPLHADDHVIAVMHDDRAVAGHCMVASRRHVENASDLTADEWAHFARVQRIVERAVLGSTGSSRAILFKLGLQTPHLHIHIYPVPASMDRAEVMRAIDGRTRVAMTEDESSVLHAETSRRIRESLSGVAT